jgi:hypothetical protein
MVRKRSMKLPTLDLVFVLRKHGNGTRCLAQVEQLLSLDCFNPVHEHLSTSASLESLQAPVKNRFVR